MPELGYLLRKGDECLAVITRTQQKHQIKEEERIKQLEERENAHATPLCEQNETSNEFADVFAEDPGRTDMIEYNILLKDTLPIKQPAYRVPYAYREELQKELSEMLRGWNHRRITE